MLQLLIPRGPLGFRFMYHQGESWIAVFFNLLALNWRFCVVCVQTGRDDGLHKEQRGQRPNDEVSSRKFHDIRPEPCRRHASRRSLRTGSHPAAAESTSPLLVRHRGRKLQPHPHAVWRLLICHDSLWRGVVLLLRSRVQLLLRCRLKWVVFSCRIITKLVKVFRMSLSLSIILFNTHVFAYALLNTLHK